MMHRESPRMTRQPSVRARGFKSMSTPIKAVLMLFIASLLIGSANHAWDIAHGGFLPYHSVPMPINVFWTALFPLDLVAALLVWTRRNWGIVLALAIMAADVAINSWILYVSSLKVESFEPLQAQTLVLGFMAGAAAFVWRRHGRPTSLKAS
jgi:hypothetical protein